LQVFFHKSSAVGQPVEDQDLAQVVSQSPEVLADGVEFLLEFRGVPGDWIRNWVDSGTGGCRRFLSGEDDEETVVWLRRHTRTGRALGSTAFVERMEGLLGLTLRPKKPGPRPRKTGS